MVENGLYHFHLELYIYMKNMKIGFKFSCLHSADDADLRALAMD